MHPLIAHLVALSGLRDRTALSRALAEAVVDLMQPQQMALLRVLQGGQRILVQPAATYSEAQLLVFDAYLPCHGLCRPVDMDDSLRRCTELAQPQETAAEGGQVRYLWPITVNKLLMFVLELQMPSPEDEKTHLLNQLLSFFANHLSLIDYSETDSLTHLLNRKTFDEHMFRILGQANADAHAQEIDLPRRRQGGDEGKQHWLAVADIDHFKKVNDTYGHLIGDEVLILVARLMKESLRLDDQLFRFGGEEFVAILQPATAKDAQEVLQRVRQTIEAFAFPQAGHITISIGYTALQHLDTPTKLLDRADEALYYAKGHGRNQVHAFENLVAAGEITVVASAASELELF